MGFDCTFHLVDEEAIRNEFVPKLLGKTTADIALDRVFHQAEELWEMLRCALDDRVDHEGDEISPKGAGSLVCQAALIYCSCFLPHHEERGIAFSLWSTDEGMDPFPDKFAHSPEVLFTEVVEAYPQLAGQFLRFFKWNYETGVFIPAKQVPKVRKWLEAQLQKIEKGYRRTYRSLLAMLRMAEERNLAFWEATDLALPKTEGLFTAEFLENAPGVADPHEQFQFPKSAGTKFGGVEDLYALVDGHPDNVTVIDLSTWPPQCHVHEQAWCLGIDCDAQGNWLLVSAYGPQGSRGPIRGRVLKDPRHDPIFVLHIEQDGEEIPIEDGFLVDGRAVLIPRQGEVGSLVSAWMQDGKKMVPAPGLPTHKVQKGGKLGPKSFVKGIARLAAGSEVLVWKGKGYEWDGSKFRRTFVFEALNTYDDFLSVPAGDDGLFYLAKRELMEIHRGGKSVHRGSKKWTNILGISPGPQGTLLLEGVHPTDGLLGVLYFLENETFIPIEPELLGDQEMYGLFAWIPTIDRIVASTEKSLYAVPTETVLSLPRYSVKTGRKVKGT